MGGTLEDLPRRRLTPVVTTSWDDGHPLDLRLAELLASAGLSGTFYVPLATGERKVMGRSALLALRQMGMEIGSHTVTHRVLTRLAPAEAAAELARSKEVLEQWLGEPVAAFAYPLGVLNRRVRAQVAAAGYRLARTTQAFLEGAFADPLRLPVSFQFFPHRASVHVRHALKEGNLRGLAHWIRDHRGATALEALVETSVARVLERGGTLHLWGHSWELEEAGLWEALASTCRILGGARGLRPATNSEALALAAAAASAGSPAGSSAGSPAGARAPAAAPDPAR